MREPQIYPTLRSSGLLWLGDMPEHWGVQRAKWLFRKMNRPPRAEDDVVTCFRDGVVTLRKNRRTSGFTESMEHVGYQGVRRGDLVIHTMDAFAGAVGVSDADGKSTGVYIVCRPRGGANPHYFSYVLREMARSQWLLALATGVRERSSDFRFETFGSQPLPFPPPDEQAAIVRFLDYWDSRIRRYIGAKRELIRLLKEYKRGVAYSAATRGVRDGVPLKPTGAIWLDDVPRHWEMVRNRSMLKLRKRPVGDRSPDYTLLSLTVRGVVPRDLTNAQGKFPTDFDTYQIVEPGDLVFCLFDMDETPRTVGLSGQLGMITGAYAVFSCSDPELGAFLNLFYQAMDDQKRLRPLYTGLRKVIQRGRFLGIATPVPPREERREILAYVASENARLDAAIGRVQQQMRLAFELRDRLVADAVTGRIEVRRLAAAATDATAALEEIPSRGTEIDETDDSLEISA